MDQGLKERLVGAAVLVAIAVWLIPWVLDGPEEGAEAPASALRLPSAEEPMPMRTQTLRLGDASEQSAQSTPSAQPAPATTPPPPPAVATAEPAKDEAAAPSQPAPQPETTLAAATTPAPAARPPPAPAASAAPKPAQPKAQGDWTVQLGSFEDEANAKRLAQRAGTFGYKAEVSSVRSGGKTLYRVRVGPQATRAAADAAASALKAHGVEARVVAAR